MTDSEQDAFLADLATFLRFLDLANRFRRDYEGLIPVRILNAIGLKRLTDPIGIRYSVRRAHLEIRLQMGKTIEV